VVQQAIHIMVKGIKILVMPFPNFKKQVRCAIHSSY